MAFFQSPPTVPHPWTSDPALRDYVLSRVPEALRGRVEGELRAVADLAGGELLHLLQTTHDEPTLTQWDPWGNRVDVIELSTHWKRAAEVAATEGLVATGYDKSLGAEARLVQFAKVYLFQPSSNVYTCPLAMTDGAAKTLLTHGSKELQERAVTRLLSRDPKVMWTSGQWMTERTGGSDVAISETEARPNGDGTFGLFGTKWFTSATTSQMALTLGRTVDESGNSRVGGPGLALFYVETRDDAGALNALSINRLKDKLGTRHVPTAELTLAGTRAIPVKGTGDGIKNITPMLTVTRTWNAVCAAGDLRRATALAVDYAQKRIAFGGPLIDKPLHRQTLAMLEAETRAALVVALRAAELLGREEHDVATPEERDLLRILTPLAKLGTGKQAVVNVSEALECFGGAGYIEDTGLPRLLRDAQVFPIWEGTTNVLSLDTLRAMKNPSSFHALLQHAHTCLQHADASVQDAAIVAQRAFEEASAWLEATLRDERGLPALETGARAFATTLVRAYGLALLIAEASRPGSDPTWKPAARTYAKTRINHLDGIFDNDDTAQLFSRPA